MKIRSAVPENGCLVFFFVGRKKNKKTEKNICKTHTHPPHHRLRKQYRSHGGGLGYMVNVRASTYRHIETFDRLAGKPSAKQINKLEKQPETATSASGAQRLPPATGHVTSSITWPVDASYAISYRCSIATESVSPAVFEIFGSDTMLTNKHTPTNKHD